MASADLLLHPVRLRIVQAFLGDRALTTSQLATELPDVPPGSLYRHMALLAKAGVVQIVAERQARGAVERTYTLRSAAAQIQPDELAAMSRDDHMHAFMAFVAGMISEFERYLTVGTPDLARDGAGYRMAGMWLTDQEFTELVIDLGAVIQPRLANSPGKKRRRRLMFTVLVPEPRRPPR